MWFYLFDDLRIRKTTMTKRISRAIDVGFGSALLLITAPVFALTAILVFLENPGPIFERQRSIGKTGRPFALLRFRTRSTEEPARYTRVGAVIHRLYIDEVPQLLNILRGDMSFVGPRPSGTRETRAISAAPAKPTSGIR
jgi:lipopolysaccharide/colanic/teichoic acid biosynthesis glycosyltransferase